MFASFRLDLEEFSKFKECEYNGYDFKSSWFQAGEKSFNEQKEKIKTKLDEFLLPDSSIDVSSLEENWFPQIEADVFLSHAHKDEKDVLEFAGYLSSLGLNVFVDSVVWGYKDDLLSEINNKYNVIKKENESGVTYSHVGAKYASTNVDLILNGALQKMIDSTECLIFLDTPNSLSMKDVAQAESKTNSAWIYSELLFVQHVRKRELNRNVRERVYAFSENNKTDRMKFKYDIDFSEMYQLTSRSLWSVSNKRSTEVLDAWYSDSVKLKRR